MFFNHTFDYNVMDIRVHARVNNFFIFFGGKFIDVKRDCSAIRITTCGY